MKATYEVMLQSREKNRKGLDMPRDFGGIIPGGMEHTVETVSIPKKTDSTALREARKIAKKKNSIILRVTKTWQPRKAD